MKNLEQALNPIAIYKATKVGVKREEESRFIEKGDAYTGPVGFWNDRLIVGDLVTSKVLDFSQNGEHFLIETQNSTYTLERVK